MHLDHKLISVLIQIKTDELNFDGNTPGKSPDRRNLYNVLGLWYRGIPIQLNISYNLNQDAAVVIVGF